MRGVVTGETFFNHGTTVVGMLPMIFDEWPKLQPMWGTADANPLLGPSALVSIKRARLCFLNSLVEALVPRSEQALLECLSRLFLAFCTFLD